MLVNGRRLAGSGGKGEFTDLSTLPAVAVERVEVLTDGASAIYGSDAVGGVVNIILRHDWEGAEATARAGIGEGGAPWEAQAGAAVGRRWASGSLVLAYEATRRSALNAADRAFAHGADLRPWGGHDRREPYAYPGNIVRNGQPYWGVPAGQPGSSLSVADLRPGQPNAQDPNAGGDLLPDQRSQSLFLAMRQQLGARLEVTGDLRYGFRKARNLGIPSIAVLTVTPANPFFVPANGAGSQTIDYSWRGELGNPLVLRSAETFAASLGAELALAGDWRAEAYGAFAQEIDEAATYNLPNSILVSEALGAVADRADTAYSPARDGYFNPYTGRPANSPAVLAAIGSGFGKQRPKDRVLTANLQADGSVLALPGGALKAAIGVQARREDFDFTGSNYTSTAVVTPSTAYHPDRSVLAVFAELRAPLVGGEGRPGLRRLELSLAARGERYSDFGTTFNPKAGLVWSPAAGLALRATWGRSFRAPGLRDLAAAPSNSVGSQSTGTGSVNAIFLGGGNPALGPETARAWTAGLDWRPSALPGLRLSLTAFDTRFEDRIDAPASRNLAVVLTDPRFAAFVTRVDPAHNADDLARVRGLLADPATRATTLPAEQIAAIIDTRLVNTGVLQVRGVDGSASYVTDAFGGRLTAGADFSRLIDYRQALTAAAAPIDFVGLAANPPKLRARATLDWSRGGLGLGLTLNQLSHFHDNAGARIRGQQTLDAQLRLAGPEGGRLKGLRLALTVRNLTDRPPPFYDNPVGYAYDPTSADPVGRFVALQLTRSW